MTISEDGGASTDLTGTPNDGFLLNTLKMFTV